MMTDTIADMLTRIRNAQQSNKRYVEVPFSKVKMAIAEILKQYGYCISLEKKEVTPAVLMIELKYDGKRPAITSIKRESSPGHRMYRKSEEMPKILNGYGIAIVSTSQGIMTAHEAKKKKIGGEVICSVY
jgi:small subunit ribosomal protein S8